MNLPSRTARIFFLFQIGGWLVACGGRSGLPQGSLASDAGDLSSGGAQDTSAGGHSSPGSSIRSSSGGTSSFAATGGSPFNTGGLGGSVTGGRTGSGGWTATGGRSSSGGAGTGGATIGGRSNSGTGGNPGGTGGSGGTTSLAGSGIGGTTSGIGGTTSGIGGTTSGIGGTTSTIGGTTSTIGGTSGCSPSCPSDEICVDSLCVCRDGVLRLSLVAPHNGSVGTARDGSIGVLLNCAPPPSAITPGVLSIRGAQGGPLPGTLRGSASDRIFLFQPNVPNSRWIAPYFPGERITARASRELGGPYQWQFFADVNRPSSAKFLLGQTITSSQTQQVALGDVDSDGDLDIAVQYRSENTHLWLNDGSGAFTDSGQALSACGGLALGDLDGDSDQDLLCAPKVLMNDGDGVFKELPATGLPNSTEDVKLNDLDGDGDLDAVIIGSPSGIFINDSSGQFTQGQDLTGFVAYPHKLAVGDLDNDGALDVIISGWSATTPALPAQRVLINDGSGVFTPSAQDFGTDASIGVDVGDLDADGDLDVFLGNWNINGVNHVWVNDGTGKFNVQQTAWTNIAASVALGDADGDGDLDAYVACGSDYGEIRLLLNDGAGNFSDTGQSVSSLYSQYIVTGDVNGDGTLDAVITAQKADTRLWLNGP